MPAGIDQFTTWYVWVFFFMVNASFISYTKDILLDGFGVGRTKRAWLETAVGKS